VSLPLATTPPLVPLSGWAKTLLTGEILGTYLRVRRLMVRGELPDVVAAIRADEATRGNGSMPALNHWRLADAAVRVLRLLPTDSRCLMRSLVLLALLQRRGVTTTLVIGVKTDPAFAAHAWVERDGVALLPAGDGEFSPLTVV
jgi:hypothetical protein